MSRAVAFFPSTLNQYERKRDRRGRGWKSVNNEGWQEWGGERLEDENDPRDREFCGSGSDGRIRSCISRVETRFAQVCFSSLSFSLSFSLRS